MMKKIVILICCVMMCLTGCDPYSGQRPAEGGDGQWICDEYPISFVVDETKEDYYCPEGELESNDITYFCKFYFIHKTDQLLISIYPLEFKRIPDESRDRNAKVGTIEGTCAFSEESFVYTIDSVTGDIFDETITELTFRKNVNVE